MEGEGHGVGGACDRLATLSTTTLQEKHLLPNWIALQLAMANRSEDVGKRRDSQGFSRHASTMSSERLCSSPAKHEGHDASFCIGCTVVDGLRSAVHTGADDERRGRSLLTIVRDGRNQMPWLSVRPSPSAAPERLCCAAPAPV